MDERTMLELAARAAGIDAEWKRWPSTSNGSFYVLNGAVANPGGPCYDPWNPLTDDGDCARLEAACGINVTWYAEYVVVDRAPLCALREHFALHGGDKNKARRYASTRAAAIGEKIPVKP